MQLLPYCILSLIDKDDFRQNTIGAVNNSENTVDELGDKIKVGIKVMTKKIKYSDKNFCMQNTQRTNSKNTQKIIEIKYFFCYWVLKSDLQMLNFITPNYFSYYQNRI